MSSKILYASGAFILASDSSHAAPAKPQIAAKSQIDPRGVAALDESVAFYRRFPSFAVTATEVLTTDESVRRNKYELNLQYPRRASLTMTETDATGQDVEAKIACFRRRKTHGL